MIKKTIDTVLNVRPIFVGIQHLYFYEGPCRFGEGDELDEIRRHNSHKEAGQEEFLWSPPGASNLPIRLFWTSESLSEALGLGEKKTKK